jgi:hypothetical protein
MKILYKKAKIIIRKSKRIEELIEKNMIQHVRKIKNIF